MSAFELEGFRPKDGEIDLTIQQNNRRGEAQFVDREGLRLIGLKAKQVFEA